MQSEVAFESAGLASRGQRDQRRDVLPAIHGGYGPRPPLNRINRRRGWPAS